jgi:hypothetical protein
MTGTTGLYPSCTRDLSHGPSRWRFAGAISLLAFIEACTTLTVRPQVRPSDTPYALQGRVETEGNPEFLPAPLRRLSTGSGPTFQYDYRVRYDDAGLGLFAVFNPLSLVGFPTGSAELEVTATLRVLQGDCLLKTYDGIATASVTRTIYTGDPLSTLRRDALLAVGDSIAAQMSHDRDLFSQESEACKDAKD